MHRRRGFHQPAGRTPDRAPALAEALREDRHVRAACLCGVMVVLDVSGWAPEAAKPLSRFADRVRCKRCGARSVPLELWYGPARARPQDAVYIFR